MRFRAGLFATMVALPLVAVAPASAQRPSDDPVRGLRYQGLRAAVSGPCAGAFEIRGPSGATSCTHGPDPAPAGVDVRVSRPPRPAARSEGPSPVEPPPTLCLGDGTSGARVQLVYARAESRPDRYDAYATSFQAWARETDRIIADSAAETGGMRRIRYVHDAGCRPVVDRVVVPDAALTDFNAMVNGLHAAGHDRGDRKYLVWMDANYYCGLGSMLRDDRPGAANAHDNGPPLYARIDAGCWGIPGYSVEAHELIHTMGGVQLTAPHSTGAYHCTDDYEVMCYPDGAGVTMTQPCPESHSNLLDCNADDYFHTAPQPGSYLATHWNLADSRFLGRPPEPPRRLVGIPGEGTVTLTWDAPVVGDVALTGYQIAGSVDATPAPPTTLPPGATRHVVEGLENGTSYRFTVRATNAVGASGPATTEPVVPTAGSLYHPLAPARILDTRVGNGAPAAPVPARGSIDLQVTGRGGVPAAGVSAVVVNLTVTQPAGAGYVTAWPTGATRPPTSNLNVVAGQTVANLAVVKVGNGGQVSLYNGAGSGHLVADVAGWYGAEGEQSGGGYHQVTPARILDTRSGKGAPAARPPTGAVLEVQVAGVGGVPATGVAAAALTVTVVGPDAAGYLTAWPTGAPRPLASNVNFDGGRTVANMVVVKVGEGGRVSLFNSGGGVDVVADVTGWYGEAPDGARFHPLIPARVLDTRSGIGAAPGAVALRATVDVAVQGRGGVPAGEVSAVVVNLTVVDPALAGYLTAWASGEPRPATSNLNFPAGATVPNLAAARPGAGGALSLYLNGGPAHLVADVAGWFGRTA